MEANGAMSEDHELQENLKSLRNFLLDIDCLDELSEWTNQFNLFEVLRIAKTEIRHSNMLAWLLDPNENHGLNDGVLKAFFRILFKKGYLSSQLEDEFDLLLMDYHDFAVYREWHAIDILLYSESEGVVVAIENKTFSNEHDDQLKRYREIISTYLPAVRTSLFVYLTPHGAESSDPDNWHAVSYEEIVDAIEATAKNAELPGQVNLLISNYIDAIRRDVLEDARLEELCLKIYNKHQKALDLLFEYRPDRAAQVRDVIQNWADEKAKQGIIVHDRSWDTLTRVRFKTDFISRIIPDSVTANSGWKTHNHYFYEIVLDRKKVRFGMGLCFNSTNASGEELLAFEKVCEALDTQLPDRPVWQYHTLQLDKSKFTVKEDTEDTAIERKLDDMLKIYLDMETVLNSKLGM